MKALKILLKLVQWISATVIILVSVMTLTGKAFLVTALLWFLAVIIVYWPADLAKRWNMQASVISRLALIAILLVAVILMMQPEPGKSIYLSEKYKEDIYRLYDEKVSDWPAGTRDLYVDSRFGKIHVLECGNTDKPPLLMLHAASMGAHSWAENLEPLLDSYHIFSVDNIGEGNKSELDNLSVFPENGIELAKLYAAVADSLGIISSPVFGASNGGFLAMNYACYFPEKVESLALFGPMGLTNLSNKSIMMLAISSMYPFQFVRNSVAKWAIGEDDYVKTKYGDWFNGIMKGTIPVVAKPVPMSRAQKQSMEMPVMLILGTRDKLVGPPESAIRAASDIRNIEIHVLESGHLVAVEKADSVNTFIHNFLEPGMQNTSTEVKLHNE